MCHPVIATGSLFVHVNLIKIVPSAIAKEAPSIQSSPTLNEISLILLSDINHQLSKSSLGTPKKIIPPKPKSKPSHPIGLIKLPKIALPRVLPARVESQSKQNPSLPLFLKSHMLKIIEKKFHPLL